MRYRFNAPDQRERPEPRPDADQDSNESPFAQKGRPFPKVGRPQQPNPVLHAVNP